MATPRLVHLSLSADGSLLREETLNGIKYIVCPVISKLGDNVEWPINAPTPEFIPSSVLSLAVGNRNSRPVVMGHPQDDNGNYISANDPGVLEKWAYGFVFAAKFEDNKVSCEMWLDPIRAENVPEAPRVIERLQNGEMVEVSEGDYVLSEIEEGTWQGKKYGAKWIACWSDHLATLPEGHIGACGIDDGCGANRVSMGLKAASMLTNIKVSALTQARRPTFTGTETSTWVKPTFADYVKYLYNGDELPTSVNKCSMELKRSIAAHTLLGDENATNFSDLTSHAVVNPSNGYLNEKALRAYLNDDNDSVKEMVKRLLNSEFSTNLEVSDMKTEGIFTRALKSLSSLPGTIKNSMINNRLYNKLWDALVPVEPGLYWLEAFDPDTKLVWYTTRITHGSEYYGETEMHLWQRSFNVDGNENVTVNDDRQEAEFVGSYKLVVRAEDEEITVSSTHECGCKGEKTMAFDRKSVINRLSASGPFVGKLKVLEEMDDKGLENLDKAFPDKVEEEKKEDTPPIEPAPAPTPLPAPAPTPIVETSQVISLSREEYAKMLAASNAFEAQQAAHKASIVANLKTAQTEFSETDLNAMDIPQLERMSRLLKVDQPTVSSTYVGLPIPRDSANQDKAPPVLSVTEKIRAMRKSA